MTPKAHKRFFWTPNDFSPTYDVETDGNGNFVKLHALWDIPPQTWPEAKQLPVTEGHIKYVSGEGFEKMKEAIGLENL